jgi:hypothetical protein
LQVKAIARMTIGGACARMASCTEVQKGLKTKLHDKKSR